MNTLRICFSDDIYGTIIFSTFKRDRVTHMFTLGTFRRKAVLKYVSGLRFPSADLTSDVFLSFPKNNRKYTEQINIVAM